MQLFPLFTYLTVCCREVFGFTYMKLMPDGDELPAMFSTALITEPITSAVYLPTKEYQKPKKKLLAEPDGQILHGTTVSQSNTLENEIIMKRNTLKSPHIDTTMPKENDSRSYATQQLNTADNYRRTVTDTPLEPTETQLKSTNVPSGKVSSNKSVSNANVPFKLKPKVTITPHKPTPPGRWLELFASSALHSPITVLPDVLEIPISSTERTSRPGNLNTLRLITPVYERIKFLNLHSTLKSVTARTVLSTSSQELHTNRLKKLFDAPKLVKPAILSAPMGQTSQRTRPAMSDTSMPQHKDKAFKNLPIFIEPGMLTSERKNKYQPFNADIQSLMNMSRGLPIIMDSFPLRTKPSVIEQVNSPTTIRLPLALVNSVETPILLKKPFLKQTNILPHRTVSPNVASTKSHKIALLSNQPFLQPARTITPIRSSTPEQLQTISRTVSPGRLIKSNSTHLRMFLPNFASMDPQNIAILREQPFLKSIEDRRTTYPTRSSTPQQSNLRLKSPSTSRRTASASIVSTLNVVISTKQPFLGSFRTKSPITSSTPEQLQTITRTLSPEWSITQNSTPVRTVPPSIISTSTQEMVIWGDINTQTSWLSTKFGSASVATTITPELITFPEESSLQPTTWKILSLSSQSPRATTTIAPGIIVLPESVTQSQVEKDEILRKILLKSLRPNNQNERKGFKGCPRTSRKNETKVDATNRYLVRMVVELLAFPYKPIFKHLAKDIISRYEAMISC